MLGKGVWGWKLGFGFFLDVGDVFVFGGGVSLGVKFLGGGGMILNLFFVIIKWIKIS